MGCWNISFWDNDEVVDFLLYLFQHMALMPFPRQRQHTISMMTNKVNGNKLMIRHTQEEYHEIQRILMSMTATTLERAKASDPHFKEKLMGDPDFFPQGLAKIGLTKEHLWTLIHMHLGAPIDTSVLDSLAKAFHTKKKGGTWVIDPYLRSLTGATNKDLEETRKAHAPYIRQGILDYKERMEKGEPLVPMKLAFIGPEMSQAMWFKGMLPEKLPPHLVWDTAYIRSLVELPKPDPTFDTHKCATCQAPEAGREEPLLKCPCGCVFFCSKECQVLVPF